MENYEIDLDMGKESPALSGNDMTPETDQNSMDLIGFCSKKTGIFVDTDLKIKDHCNTVFKKFNCMLT